MIMHDDRLIERVAHGPTLAGRNHHNLVEVYIQRLRRKVDDSEPTKLIQTIRGAGYRIGDST